MRPGFKEISKEGFESFLLNYPQSKLEHNCVTIHEPPLHDYHDWSIAKSKKGTAEAMHESLVAYCYEDWLPPVGWHFFIRSADQTTASGEPK